MKSINVQVVDGSDISRQYDASFYATDGLYLWPMDNQLLSVLSGAVTCVGYCYDWQTFPSGQIADASTGGISENLFLKALAISQNPELIREI